MEELRFALRGLRRSPGFAAAVVLALGLGTGATTAIFSVVDGVLLRPLPYAGADRVVRLFESNPALGRAKDGPSPLNFIDWRQRLETFSHVAAWHGNTVTLRGEAGPEALRSCAVTPAFFEALGASPVLGAGFDPRTLAGSRTDGTGRHVAGDRVLVISHGLWQRRFGGDPGVIGREIEIERAPWRVVGVMPGGFAFPDAGVDAWTAWDISGAQERAAEQNVRSWRFLGVIARLAPGSTLERARRELGALAASLAETYPGANAGWGAVAVPLKEELVGSARPALLALFGAVGFVLLIACSNAASLLLARASERRREIAVRLALGVTRLRLVRQLLAESGILALCGGTIGLLLAHAAVATLVALRPSGLPRLAELAVDARALGFTLGVAVLAALLSALTPALQALRGDLALELRAARGSTLGRVAVRRAIVTGQMALALLLLAGAALLGRSFARVASVDPGFRTERLLVGRLAVERDAGPFYRALIERLEARSGVLAAAATTALPLSDVGIDFDRPYWREGEALSDGEARLGDIRIVTPGYFRALEIPLLRGRSFAARDRPGAPEVVIVNRSLALREWPGSSPVGRRLVIDYRGGRRPYHVVGVVGDTRFRGLRSEPRPEIFLPHEQVPYLALNIAVRTRGEAGALASDLRAAVSEVDPQQPVQSIVTMDQLLSRSSAPDRLVALLLAALAGLAVTLAATGVYGLLSYLVAGRGREIAVRMALGARRADVLGLVLGDALRMTLAGGVVGLALALAVGRSLRGLLFGVGPADPLSLGSALLLVAGVGLLAGWLPARRASAVEPGEALRAE